MIFLVIGLVLLFYVGFRMFKSFRLPDNNIICLTGTLGTGKTYMAVASALRAYKRQRMKHWIYKMCKLFAYVCPESKFPAAIYTNIPVQLNLSRRRPKYSEPFTKQHLLMIDHLPERCVVLIDELGQFCSQWEFDNPYVMQNVQTLIRFFRHFTNGKMFVTDQVSSNIVKPIRDRLGFVYQLNDFRRDFFILPFFKVDVIPLLTLDDGKTNVETDDITQDYFWGFLPYKWMKIKHYESRCYKLLYTENAERESSSWDGLFTHYLIDISVAQSTRKDYKMSPDKYKDYLYDRFKDNNLVSAPADDLKIDL